VDTKIGAEPNLFGNYSRTLAVDTLRIGGAILNPLWCVRFFIVIQASFHKPSRIALRVMDFVIFGWCTVTIVDIGFAANEQWKPANHIQIQAVFAAAIIVFFGLGYYSIRILRQVLPTPGPGQTADDVQWTEAQRKTLRFIRIIRAAQVVVVACVAILALVSSKLSSFPSSFFHWRTCFNLYQ
jgi:hypothetical protein